MVKIFIASILALSTYASAEVKINKVGLNLGLYNMDCKDYGILQSGVLPSKQHLSTELYMLIDGLIDSNNLYKVYTGYMHGFNDDSSNDLLLVGVNRHFKTGSVEPYLGAVVGYGVSNWKTLPATSSYGDRIATSLVAGLQAGAEYPITKNLALGVHSKLIWNEYETFVNSSKALTHNLSTNILLGLSYSFNGTKNTPVQKISTKEEVIKSVENTYIKEEIAEVKSAPKVVSIAKKTYLDSDKDGVLDVNDECLDTRAIFDVDKAGCPLKMKRNIEFAYKSVEIDKIYYGDILNIALHLKRFKDKSVVVDAYTDSVGSSKYNKNLALNRALQFKEILVSLGIDSKRINLVTHGEDMLLSDDASQAHLNRRLEISFK